MTTIALVGAGGKMGCRLTDNFLKCNEYLLQYLEISEQGIQNLLERNVIVSNDPGARVSGKYFYHMRQSPFNPLAKDEHIQDKFLQQCEKFSGMAFPA